MIRNIIALIEIRSDRKKSEASLKELQKKRLYKLLCYVNKNVPFYKQFFNSIQYNPKKDFSGLNDIKLLPIINKQTIRDYGFNQFLSNVYNVSKLNCDYSSGSTGQPFKSYRNPWFYSYQLANFFSVLLASGFRFTDKMISFSAPYRLKNGKTILSQINILRRLVIDYNLSPSESLKKVLDYKPQIMHGNPSSFELLVLEMRKQNIKIDFVKIIFAGGAAVTDALQKECYERFGIGITEFYGSIEFGVLAYKNRNENCFHLCNYQTIFEFLDDNNNNTAVGESGKIVITSLISKAFPFIRYDIGDIGSSLFVKNNFGEDSIKLNKLIGRDNAIAELKDGRKIAFQAIFSLMNKHTGILQYKVVQEELDRFKVYIVTESNEYFQDNIDIIRTNFDNLFNESASYSIEKVAKILNDQGGKIKTFVPLPLLNHI